MSWTLRNDRSDKTNELDSKDAAKEKKSDMVALGVNPEDLTIIRPDGEPLGSAEKEPKPDGGETTPEVVEADTEATTDARDSLPDKPPVDTDPMDWVPSDFIDHIDGSPAINRKGYEVLAHHYNIGTTSECVVGPEETSFEYARVKATAVTDDGTKYQAHGSATVSGRGDDKHLLLEMADTRARKRAIAQATGVGMVAVQELQNEL